ncbi:MAG: hypothetical protein ACXWFB_06280 [Nitrososphaeraceae archaeon]
MNIINSIYAVCKEESKTNIMMIIHEVTCWADNLIKRKNNLNTIS